MDELFRLTLRIEEEREETDWKKIAEASRQPLSPEARKTLETKVIDFREIMVLHQAGLPLPSVDDAPLAKRASTPAPAARVEKFENGWTVEYADDGSVVRGFAAGVDPEVAFAR